MKRLARILRQCLGCPIEFEISINSTRKFHNRECYQKEWAERAKNFKKDFPKGHEPWNLGKKIPYAPREYRRGIRVSPKTEFKYKNGTGQYILAHKWIYKQKGKANKCEEVNCENKSKNYQWANLSGKYLLELDDWKMMCIPCHKKFDLAIKKFDIFPENIKKYLKKRYG